MHIIISGNKDKTVGGGYRVRISPVGFVRVLCRTQFFQPLTVFHTYPVKKKQDEGSRSYVARPHLGKVCKGGQSGSGQSAVELIFYTKTADLITLLYVTIKKLYL